MKKYVEKILHAPIYQEDIDIDLPLLLKKQYLFEKWDMDGSGILVAYPSEDVGITVLRQHLRKFEDQTDLPIAFAFEDISIRKAEKMIEEGIPFIQKNKQVYLPFLGVLWRERKRSSARQLPVFKKVSPQTQRFILQAIYHRWFDMNLAAAAEKLDVARMTATRIFNELEVIEPSWIHMDGKERWFSYAMKWDGFWDAVEPYLFNPVIRQYRLKYNKKMLGLPLGGMSAVSRYSMIEDNVYETFAVNRDAEKRLGLSEADQVPGWDQPECVIQVLKYKPFTWKYKDVIDPLTAILSLDKDEKRDPRVEGEIEMIMRKVFNA